MLDKINTAMLVSVAAAALALTGCERAPEEPRVEVTNAWVRLPAVPGRPGAAYFTMSANNDPNRLAGVASPRIERIELHGSGMEGGMMRMAPLGPGETTFDQDGQLVFEAGGKHAMLFGLDPALRPGDRVALTFQFEPASPVTVEAQVVSAGDAAPESE